MSVSRELSLCDSVTKTARQEVLIVCFLPHSVCDQVFGMCVLCRGLEDGVACSFFHGARGLSVTEQAGR